jgi:hypothetical protein
MEKARNIQNPKIGTNKKNIGEIEHTTIHTRIQNPRSNSSDSKPSTSSTQHSQRSEPTAHRALKKSHARNTALLIGLKKDNSNRRKRGKKKERNQ